MLSPNNVSTKPFKPERVGRKKLQELTQFNPISQPRHLMGKRTAILGTCANSADSVHMPQNAAPNQEQHCLLTGLSVQNTMIVKTGTLTLAMNSSQ